MTRPLQDDELLEILLADDAQELEAVLAACRRDPVLAVRVRAWAELQTLLATGQGDAPATQPTPEQMARYLHAPEALSRTEERRIQLHVASDPAIRETLRAMRKFAGGSPTEEPWWLADAATERRRAIAPRRNARRLAALLAAALLVPVVGYATYSAYSAWNQRRAMPLPSETSPPRESADPQPSQRAAQPPTAPQSQAAPRSDVEASGRLAPPTPASRTGPAVLSIQIAGMGITNPEEICAALGLGEWSEVSGGSCDEGRIISIVERALRPFVISLDPDIVPDSATRIELTLLRVRQTQDHRLRIRSELATRTRDGGAAAPWLVQAGFEVQPEARRTDPDAPLRLEAAVFTPPTVCAWAEQEALPLCQLYSRFTPTLIKALPAGPLWRLGEPGWVGERTLRVPLEAMGDPAPGPVALTMERDDDTLPHWTVLESQNPTR